MKKIFGICFYNVGNPVCGIKAKCKGLLIQALFLYVKNFFLQISHICNRTECSYYEERRIRGGSPSYPLKQLHDRKIQKILVLLRGPSVKNNLSHTGHCVVTGQGWEKLRLERGGLALHSYRFHFWFECVSKGVASPIMHRNRRCPSLLFSWLLSWKQRAYVPESQSSSS